MSAPPLRGSVGRAVVVVAALLVVALATAGANGTAAAANGVEVTNVTVEDKQVVDRIAGLTYLWRSGPHNVTVALEGESHQNGTNQVCVAMRGNFTGSPRELACEDVSLTGNGTQHVEFELGPWPEEFVGPGTLRVAVNGSRYPLATVAEAQVPVHVLEKEEDVDGDGLVNRQEVEHGTDLNVRDTDGDGIQDGVEVDEYGTDPLSADTDDDGLRDGREVTLGTEPMVPDTDGDGLLDGEEVRKSGTDPLSADTDDDGLTDHEEIHEYETDPTKGDTDGDGLSDHEEIHEFGTDPTQADTDDDGLEDGREVDLGTDPLDSDSDDDGVRDGEEVDEGTDPLDPDSDDDGLADGLEARLGTDPTTPNRMLWVGTLGISAVLVLGAALLYLSGRWRHLAHLPVPWPAGDGRDDGDGDGEAVAASGGDGGGPDGPGGAADSTGPGAPTGGVGGSSPQVGGDSPASHVARSSDGQRAGDGTPGGPPGGVPAVEPAAPILTDEDRVLRLLAERGGRMKQRKIPEETDWSKSKVSRLLSRMAEDGSVSKISVGRENIITLAGYEPEGAQNPFGNLPDGGNPPDE